MCRCGAARCGAVRDSGDALVCVNRRHPHGHDSLSRSAWTVRHLGRLGPVSRRHAGSGRRGLRPARAGLRGESKTRFSYGPRAASARSLSGPSLRSRRRWSRARALEVGRAARGAAETWSSRRRREAASGRLRAAALALNMLGQLGPSRHPAGSPSSYSPWSRHARPEGPGAVGGKDSDMTGPRPEIETHVTSQCALVKH